MMSYTFLFLSLLGICLATQLELEKVLEPLSDAQISYINRVQSSWTAGRTFKQEEYERVKKRLSSRFDKSKRYNIRETNVEIRDDLPEKFDSRKKWPHCKSIGEIRDQSDCASAWALAPVAALTDRFCIHNKSMVHLSAEDVTSCIEGTGCDGGDPYAAWDYFQKHGVVTGGNYNSSTGCMPYSLPNCDQFGSHAKYPPCPRQGYPTPPCTKKCRKGYGKTYEQDKHFALPMKVVSGEEQIMQELVDHGPLNADVDIYDDFLSYKSGIYKHTTGTLIAVQSMKLIGYGVENGQKYWIAANSFNEGWGENGFFRIAKGVDECQIEKETSSSMPKI